MLGLVKTDQMYTIVEAKGDSTGVCATLAPIVFYGHSAIWFANDRQLLLYSGVAPIVLDILKS